MTVTKKKFNLLFKGTELIVAGKLKDSKNLDFNTTLDAESTEGNFNGSTIVTCFDIPIVSPPDVQTRRIGISIDLIFYERWIRVKIKKFIVFFIIGHLERLWAYLSIQQLMDKYELDKHENSTAKAEALRLALEVSILYYLCRVIINVHFIFSIHL